MTSNSKTTPKPGKGWGRRSFGTPELRRGERAPAGQGWEGRRFDPPQLRETPILDRNGLNRYDELPSLIGGSGPAEGMKDFRTVAAEATAHVEKSSAHERAKAEKVIIETLEALRDGRLEKIDKVLSIFSLDNIIPTPSPDIEGTTITTSNEPNPDALLSGYLAAKNITEDAHLPISPKKAKITTPPSVKELNPIGNERKEQLGYSQKQDAVSLPQLPEGLHWPTEKFGKSPEAHTENGIIKFLERVWRPLIAAGFAERRYAAHIDKSVIDGIKSLKRSRTGSRTVPEHLRFLSVGEAKALRARADAERVLRRISSTQLPPSRP